MFVFNWFWVFGRFPFLTDAVVARIGTRHGIHHSLQCSRNRCWLYTSNKLVWLWEGNEGE